MDKEQLEFIRTRGITKLPPVPAAPMHWAVNRQMSEDELLAEYSRGSNFDLEMKEEWDEEGRKRAAHAAKEREEKAMPKANAFTEGENQEIIRLHGQGKNDKEIAEAIGRSDVTIGRHRRELGLAGIRGRRRTKGSGLVRKLQREAAKAAAELEELKARPSLPEPAAIETLGVPALAPVAPGVTLIKVPEEQPGVATSPSMARMVICDIPLSGDTSSALVEMLKAALAR